MAGYVANVLDTSRNIGFCFSYPIEMFPNKDGRALYFSKEIKADEAAGQMIGQSLNLAIRRMGESGRKHVVLLNDTVATLLAGRGSVVRAILRQLHRIHSGHRNQHELRRAEQGDHQGRRPGPGPRARSSTSSPAGSARPREALSTRNSTPAPSAPASTSSRR